MVDAHHDDAHGVGSCDAVPLRVDGFVVNGLLVPVQKGRTLLPSLRLAFEELLRTCSP